MPTTFKLPISSIAVETVKSILTCNRADGIRVHFRSQGLDELRHKLICQLDALVGDQLDGDQLARTLEHCLQVRLKQKINLRSSFYKLILLFLRIIN